MTIKTTTKNKWINKTKKMKEIYLEIYHKQNISGFVGRVGVSAQKNP